MLVEILPNPEKDFQDFVNSKNVFSVCYIVQPVSHRDALEKLRSALPARINHMLEDVPCFQRFGARETCNEIS